jgi:hypothetical protein
VIPIVLPVSDDKVGDQVEGIFMLSVFMFVVGAVFGALFREIRDSVDDFSLFIEITNDDKTDRLTKWILNK